MVTDGFKSCSTIIYTSNNSSVFPHPFPAVPVRHGSEQQQLTKIPPLHQSFPFHPWICKCVSCAISGSTKQMQGNENGTSLRNIRSFPYADWARKFCQSVASPPCAYLTSASVFTILTYLLLVCASCRVLPSCVSN